MFWRLKYVFLASQLFSRAIAAQCNPLAVSLPFQRTVLANRAEARGVPFQIGKPTAQSIALLPSASYNDTYVYGTNGFCAANIQLEECTTYRGGLYDSSHSDRANISSPIRHVYDAAGANWTTDDVVLKDRTDKDIELTQLEFGIRVSSSHPYVNLGELGLGVNSTFLSALSSGQKITSKVYSFFWGTDAAISDKPRSGSLTLGGYDQALISDLPNTTTTFNRSLTSCREGMIVELTGLSLESEGGGTQNILETSKKMQACVVPTAESVLTLPANYWAKMAEIMGVKPAPQNTSRGLFYGVASVTSESANFTGNLSISINDALTVTIPNEQLIFDEPYIVPDGRILKGDWKNIPIVSYKGDDSTMPRLGGMFFSSAYLMVNHDKNEFTISQVQEQPAAQNLMGIDTANDCVAALEDGGSNGLSGGAIAGIVVGVVAAIGIIATIAFLIWRRRRTSAAAVPISSNPKTAYERVPVVEKYGYSTSEMYAGQSPGEVSGHARDYAVELDGNSRPSEVPAHSVERVHLADGRR
ncbi:Nn.00g056440.m01.CDS01 [Neocucurbitaria sp. VM-36]